MNFNVKSRVTEFSDLECPRRIQLQILTYLKNVPKESEVNINLIAGNLLHNTLQETFLRNFSSIEYFYIREKKHPLEEAIYEVIKIIFEQNSKFLTNEPSLLSYEAIVSQAINLAETMLWKLSLLSKTLIIEKENELVSKVLKEEFSVQKKLENNVLLTGKIDLIAIEPDHLRIIELKTGGDYPEHLNQVRIYGEILKSYYSGNDLKLELWYVNSKSKKDGIFPLEMVEEAESLLGTINKRIKSVELIDNERKLPPMIDQYKRFKCKFCKLCNQKNLEKVFEIKSSKNLLDFL